MVTRAALKIHDWRRNKEIIIPCHRHCDAFYILKEFGYTWSEYDTIAQGFLDQNDNFLTRIEAAKEAIKCKQVKPDFQGELYSEDIY